MKMTWSRFSKWVSGQSQWTENEALNPHNRDEADSEILDVIELTKALGIMRRLASGEIEIVEEDE